MQDGLFGQRLNGSCIGSTSQGLNTFFSALSEVIGMASVACGCSKVERSGAGCCHSARVGPRIFRLLEDRCGTTSLPTFEFYGRKTPTQLLLVRFDVRLKDVGRHRILSGESTVETLSFKTSTLRVKLSFQFNTTDETIARPPRRPRKSPSISTLLQLKSIREHIN